MKRERVPLFVSPIVAGRPVRWAPPRRLVGDYDGRERTLEIFNADPKDQGSLFDEIDRQREPLEEAAGGLLVIIFHSVRQSTERYADFVNVFGYPKVVAAPRGVAPPTTSCEDTTYGTGPHRRVAAAA
jgi:hypothetical protein